jgi:DNA repair protein RadC
MPSEPEEKPHYHGHRQRLRQRLIEAGPGTLPDYEILEVLLFAANPRGDTKPLAKTLIERFGSFAGVINAPKEALLGVDGI